MVGSIYFSLSLLGKLIIGTTKGFIRGKALSVEGHTHNYAAGSHTHSAGNITSGTLPVTRGGTGVTSLDALKSALGISTNNLKYASGTSIFISFNNRRDTIDISSYNINSFILISAIYINETSNMDNSITVGNYTNSHIDFYGDIGTNYLWTIIGT